MVPPYWFGRMVCRSNLLSQRKTSFLLHWFSSRLARKIISEDAHTSTKRGRITWSGKKQDRDCPLSAAARHYIISTILFKQPLWEISFGAKCWPQESWDCEQTHSLLFGISGKQDFWAGFFCYAISSKAELPRQWCKPNSCKAVSKQNSWLTNTATQLPFQRQIAQDVGKINLDLSAKYCIDIPRETSDSITFFSTPEGNNQKHSKFWLTA